MSLSRLRSVDMHTSGAAGRGSQACPGIQPKLISLASDCGQLLYDSKFWDVCFVCCDGNTVNANRAFLAVRSAFFRGMLYGGLEEAGLSQIKLPEVKAAALRIVLHCLHTAEVKHAGEVFEVGGLYGAYCLTDCMTRSESCRSGYLRQLHVAHLHSHLHALHLV